MRFKRYSIIVGRNYKHQLVAPIIYQGTANTDWVIQWTRDYLLPVLEPNSVLVFDNASIHKSDKLKVLIEEAGHQIIFLSAYSPDLNPIEHKWEEIKHNLAKFYDIPKP